MLVSPNDVSEEYGAFLRYQMQQLARDEAIRHPEASETGYLRR